MRAVVVALGKIGLPLAAHIARAGHDVVGADIDPRVVGLVNDARAPFPGETGLEELLGEVVPAGRLRATTDTTTAVAEGADLVVVVPPVMVDAQARPDFGALDAALDAVAGGLRGGEVVSVETTIPVGTTRDRVAPALGRDDVHVVHSPERVFSGRVFRDLETYPKLVGGVTPEAEARAMALYEQFLGAEVRGLGSAEAAELAKLAETTYRDLNIAFANELARYADRLGIDVAPVIDAANSQPFSHIHQPGVAVGGHCIPVYPRFLLAGDPEAQLPRTARAVNEAMPAYAAERLAAALGGLHGARVLVLGVAYRGGVKETAFSGAAPLRDALAARGAEVVASDPLFDPAELRAEGYAPWDGGPVDGVVVQADHAAYRALGGADLPGARAIVDGRRVLDPARFDVPVHPIGGG
jgi:UDP-N-acetyl-D-glucosamine dehydrogenase